MVFSSQKTFAADPGFIPAVAEEVALQFQTEGYTAKCDHQVSGDACIYITKGGIFKAICGMKTALKIQLKSGDNSHIIAHAGVGIFGQQVIPTLISLTLFWPLLLTQTWGMIKQSKLDNYAIELIEKSLASLTASGAYNPNGIFCPECGTRTDGEFCSGCGKKMN